MHHYADSSFLVSCYVVDTNTPLANAWLSLANAPLVFTALHALEVRNAFQLGVFRGLFSAADAATTWANLEKDLSGGRLIKTAVNWPAALRMASRLSEQHSAVIGARSLDILHVAVARTLGTIEFVSFDSRQSALAARVGLSVAP